MTAVLAISAWLAVLYDLLCGAVHAPSKPFVALIGVGVSASLAVSVVCALHSYEQLLRHVARTSYAQGREDKHELRLVRKTD